MTSDSSVPPPDSSTLAFTGGRVLIWTLVGLVLLAGGVASILVSTGKGRREEDTLNTTGSLS